MKVKCINEGWWVENRRFLWRRFKRKVDGPKFGDILTVIDDDWEEGIRYYQLKEWPTKKEDGWQADCFVPMENQFERVSFEHIKESNPIAVNPARHPPTTTPRMPKSRNRFV